MTVYVDDANIPYRGMIMSHLWADTLPELLAMVDAIGVRRKWLQRPPKASWVHFDISHGKKKLAIARGAVLTDIYGPVEHTAKLNIASGKPDLVAYGQRKLDQIASIREKHAPAPLVDRTEPQQGALAL
jgi:hypothetical protein